MRKSLTKQERLCERAEIRKLFRSGENFSCKGLKIYRHENGLGFTRAVFSPGRQCKNAVERNHVKRHGKEVYRHIKYLIKPGFNIAFVFFPGDYTFQDRHAQMIRTLDKAGLLDQI